MAASFKIPKIRDGKIIWSSSLVEGIVQIVRKQHPHSFKRASNATEKRKQILRWYNASSFTNNFSALKDKKLILILHFGISCSKKQTQGESSRKRKQKSIEIVNIQNDS